MLSVFAVLLALPAHEGPFRSVLLDEALATARAGEGARQVLVFVHAEWCGPCNQLAAEVLTQPAGEALAKDGVAVEVDAESAAGQKVVTRYGVIGYPTLLVLDAQGAEQGRVEGYEGKEAWLEALAQARTATRSLESLEADLRAEQPERVVLAAQALLVRGHADQAVPVLEAALSKGGPPGIDAGRVLGRYYTRVRRDGVAGARVFSELVQRSEGTPAAGEFLYWMAQSLAVAGRFDAAMEVTEKWAAAEPKSSEPLMARATVAVRCGLPDVTAREAIQRALALDPKLGGAYYLAAELELRLGDKEAAAAAIQKALAIDPTRLTWRNFAQRRLGLELP